MSSTRTTRYLLNVEQVRTISEREARRMSGTGGSHD